MSNQAYPPLRLSPDQAKETAMVDLAFMILKTANTPFYYRDLMMEVAKYKGFTDEQTREVIAQLYTEINVDGRFACVGNNLWGLKRWYPVDNKAEDNVGGKRPRIINDDDDDLDEEDSFPEEEETYTADEEDFDSFDEDREEVSEEEEEFFPEEAEEEEEAEELEEELDEEEEEDFEDEAEEDEDDEK